MLLDAGADPAAMTLPDEDDPKSIAVTPLDVAKDPAVKEMLEAALSAGDVKDEV